MNIEKSLQEIWRNTGKYKVYLTNGKKLLIYDYDFNKILKEMRETKK